MSNVAVLKCHNSESASTSLSERIESITDSIRQCAFNLFQNRNGHQGSELEDWLQAEREVVSIPTSELTGDDNKFVARIALPGFNPKDVHISAMPGVLIVDAASSHTAHGNGDGVRFCEFSDKQVYRRIDWPDDVDVDNVTASLDKGILEVSAPRQMPVTAPAKAMAAAAS